MPISLEKLALAAAIDAFGETPNIIAQAPARVELLGNHTDHNGGLVPAAAIDRYTLVVGRAVEGRQGAVRSAQPGGSDAFPSDNLSPAATGDGGAQCPRA